MTAASLLHIWDIEYGRRQELTWESFYVFALVPLKDRSAAKSRLSSILNEERRRDLAAGLAENVLNALTQAQEITGVCVVTDDPHLSRLADAYGVDVLADPLNGLNPAVSFGLEQLAKRGIDQCLVLHGDLPLVSAADVDGLVRSYRRQLESTKGDTIGLVACKSGQGTNALILRADMSFPLHYGEKSFHKHLDQAKQQNIQPIILDQPVIALDIDAPDDLIEAANRLDPRSTKPDSTLHRILMSVRSMGDPATLDLVLRNAAAGKPVTRQEADILSAQASLKTLMETAAQIRDRGFGPVVTYSRKIFLPLTHLCRDVCHYCTFAQRPSQLSKLFMSPDDALKVARQGAELGCKEVLLTLGEMPEARYAAAREALATMGFASTLDYVTHIAKYVHEETGLLPHINAGCMTDEEMLRLKEVSASMGVMLETSSPRLSQKGEAHFGSPDKDPFVRLDTLARAGRLKVPFTTGILIGIGETRQERIDSLFAIRDLHERFGHIQEVIIQNFVPKSDTKMSAVDAATGEDLQWTIAMARLIFGAEMSLQAPPNLTHGDLTPLLEAGINDWGGVSPLTPDYVNPESPWPHIDDLAKQSARGGKVLQQRLTVYPDYIAAAETWLSPHMKTATLKLADGAGLAREDDWLTGQCDEGPQNFAANPYRMDISPIIRELLEEVTSYGTDYLNEEQIGALFNARGPDLPAVIDAADQMRRQQVGETLTYVINRNINYTNMCTYRCQFCAFSKGRRREGAADAAYLMDLEEIARRAQEAWDKGATEVCLQGGIHPNFTGETYLDICRTIRAQLPDMHIHAFSPLEVWHGAESLNLSLVEFLIELKKAGLGSMPGTAAEILDDEVRDIICPDKINTRQWLDVMAAAHSIGLRTTSTIMFGHVDTYVHWARHLLRLKELQRHTNGFTEFVPLPFVAAEAPLFRKGHARLGPTYREAVLMHSVARLVLGEVIPNIQTSWVKMGQDGVKASLMAGANDMGGTLMNESITRAAGASHGQEWTRADMSRIAADLNRPLARRSTLYRPIEDSTPQLTSP